MVFEAKNRKRTGKRWSALTNEEKAEVIRVVDEYEFVNIVLKYKSALMPDDLVRELLQQNDIRRKIIEMSLPLIPTREALKNYI